MLSNNNMQAVAEAHFQGHYQVRMVDGPPSGSDWWPAGHSVITETIRLSDDGQTYASAIAMAIFDRTGAPIAGGGEGTGAGTRITF